MEEKISANIVPLEARQRTEMIGLYCDRIEKAIQQSATYQDAVQIVERECSAFSQECKSEILQKTLRQIAQDIIRKKWNSER